MLWEIKLELCFALFVLALTAAIATVSVWGK